MIVALRRCRCDRSCEPPEILATQTSVIPQKSASAGINSAHRCFAFAVARCIPTEQLPDVAARESRLTHVHRTRSSCGVDMLLTRRSGEAVECSMVVSMICRRLLEGCDLKTSIMHGHALATVDSLKLMLTPAALRSLTESRISPGGAPPDPTACTRRHGDVRGHYASPLQMVSRPW